MIFNYINELYAIGIPSGQKLLSRILVGFFGGWIFGLTIIIMGAFRLNFETKRGLEMMTLLFVCNEED